LSGHADRWIHPSLLARPLLLTTAVRFCSHHDNTKPSALWPKLTSMAQGILSSLALAHAHVACAGETKR